MGCVEAFVALVLGFDLPVHSRVPKLQFGNAVLEARASRILSVTGSRSFPNWVPNVDIGNQRNTVVLILQTSARVGAVRPRCSLHRMCRTKGGASIE
jgi:hypothetical protein